MGSPESGLDYVKSLPSVFKIIELVVILIGIGTVGFFLGEREGDYEKKDNIKAFVGIAAVAGIVVIVTFVVFVIGVHKKLIFRIVNWSKAGVVVFAALAVLLLVASGVLAAAVKYYEDKDFCNKLDVYKADAQCEHLIVGVVCGFIAMVLFIADAVIHFRM